MEKPDMLWTMVSNNTYTANRDFPIESSAKKVPI